MTDWDADSRQLHQNLRNLLRRLRDAAEEGQTPDLEDLRTWHGRMMLRLSAPNPGWVGVFRGESAAREVEVQVGGLTAVPADRVVDELAAFMRRFERHLDYLDRHLPDATERSSEQVMAVIDLCAWAHAEWVRIHPFVNGNGRMARLLANFVAMRFGLPPFVQLRPRPDDDYGVAAQRAMQGNWKPTVAVFEQMLVRFLDEGWG